MLTIDRQIQELRAELAGSVLTRRERVQAQAALTALIARRAARERAFDARIAEDAAPG
ncbi:hypothetical protein [Azospirillum lipoferum]|uniref:Uncharacterized protein n=1 Tax=Azospirillum lipoferum (strain 4B) TaxID=862719 RepID=G7ZCB3_AZOL4|nr:hypothetical protein [Azospirillum lipoferum]CBS89240.1 protein of unknown function [Azospirillum lipoferum 4B]